MIRAYINLKYMVKSSDEFLLKINDLVMTPAQKIVSLDVSSLFTNVPVDRTIDIIIEQAFSHPSIPPPVLPEDDLRNLLLICTKETPFKLSESNFIQVDGVSMGCPLGPTFADFYMSHVENLILNQNRASNPHIYMRYVDDIFCVFNSNRHINLFKQRLHNHCILKFTTEEMKNNSFNFLDVKLQRLSNGKIQTSVYVKSTDTGVYTNFQSHTPMQYKKSIIKTLVTRAIKHSSNWQLVHLEFERIKQIMANNQYPQHLTEKIIKDRLDKYFEESQPEESNTVQLFYKLGNLSTFTQDTNALKNIVQQHVKATPPRNKVAIKTYMKPNKMASQFSTRRSGGDFSAMDRSNVVYSFNCSEEGCNASYCGYTTNKLSIRIKQHRYAQSSIYKHFTMDHDKIPPTYDSLKDMFKVVYQSPDTRNVKIAEAILIKTERPIINIKYSELIDFLKLV